MSMMLRVCPREQKLITALLKKCTDQSIVLMTDKVLGTGDIVIHATNNADATPFATIERKTQADLMSSLKDKRYSTQTDRLKAMVTSSECHVAGYIVEGNTPVEEIEQLAHVRDSVLFQHRLLFCETRDVDATASLLCRITEKAAQWQKKIDLGQEATAGLVGGAPTGSFAKKGDLRTKHFFQHQLMLVPGVSANIAGAISSVYPTLKGLYTAWENCNDVKNSQMLLASLTAGASKRRIGEKLSTKIHTLFYNEST